MTTLADIIEDSRQRYNAVGDKFFNDIELVDLVYDAEMELALATEGIEKVFTASTVADQREYDYPTNALRLFRVTYDGKRLGSSNFIEDDAYTGQKETTATNGEPDIYQIFADRIYLRPVPSAVGTLKIYAKVTPTALTATTDSITTLERYRPMLKDYVLSQMFAKDKNGQMVTYYGGRWQNNIRLAKQTEMKRKIGDRYPVVGADEVLAADSAYLGKF